MPHNKYDRFTHALGMIADENIPALAETKTIQELAHILENLCKEFAEDMDTLHEIKRRVLRLEK